MLALQGILYRHLNKETVKDWHWLKIVLAFLRFLNYYSNRLVNFTGLSAWPCNLPKRRGFYSGRRRITELSCVRRLLQLHFLVYHILVLKVYSCKALMLQTTLQVQHFHKFGMGKKLIYPMQGMIFKPSEEIMHYKKTAFSCGEILSTLTTLSVRQTIITVLCGSWGLDILKVS